MGESRGFALSHAAPAHAQHDHAATDSVATAMAAHMEMSPARSGNKADSARAASIASEKIVWGDAHMITGDEMMEHKH